MNEKYRHRYELCWRFGNKEHMWIVETRYGAVHLHITEYGERMKEYEPSGGVEYHWREAPEWAGVQAPHFPECPILKAPCWHDGSSSYASDHYIPMWRAGMKHEDIFRGLERDIERTIHPEQQP